MVDTSGRIDAIARDYVEPGEYFTINRPRQFGKTTTLEAIRRRLAGTDTMVDLSFEALGAILDSEERFIPEFCRLIARSLESSPRLPGLGVLEDLTAPFAGAPAFPELGERISRLTAAWPGRIVVLIDEVDQATDYAVFAGFLGLLRDKYINRTTGAVPTFHSVILAGVHDVKNLKKRIRPDSEHAYNSPWNIAVPFTVDLAFAPADIATMLREFEADHHTGMDVTAVAESLFGFTSGYPFLVSRLSEIIHATGLPWSHAGVEAAVAALLHEQNTLFDDLIKNLELFDDLRELVGRIVLRGDHIPFNRAVPVIDLGAMYGILATRGNGVQVGNRIFETYVTEYLVAREATTPSAERFLSDEPRFVHEGRLDVAQLVTRFAAFMREEYRDEDGAFIERHARLLFLAFLRPVVNGRGFYFIEPETRGARRMDIVVVYGGEEHIVELKIWHGRRREDDAVRQLAGYLASRGQGRGFLVSFTDQARRPRQDRTFETEGRTITEAVVAYRDQE
jgi:hypothetical protein